MKITYQWEPLQTKPAVARSRKPSQFKASFSDTQFLLDSELGKLAARNVVLQVDCDRADIRLDGQLRTGTKLRSPAVAISFESKHGTLTYPCDTFSDWQDNLRAIALALEALRKIDRYGVSGKGEQYTGWARLPAPGSMTFQSKNDALAALGKIVGPGRVSAIGIEAAIREACHLTHPDKGGTADAFKRVEEIRKTLLA